MSRVTSETSETSPPVRALCRNTSRVSWLHQCVVCPARLALANILFYFKGPGPAVARCSSLLFSSFLTPPPVKLVVHSVQLHDTICIYNIVESHWGKYLVLGRAIRAGSNSFIGWGYLGERRGE